MGRTGPHGPGVDGSVAVELGLSAPMLVILAVGIVDLGNWFNFNQALEAATRIGAEYAERGFQLPTDGWLGRGYGGARRLHNGCSEHGHQLDGIRPCPQRANCFPGRLLQEPG
jgi:hypothetical protein